MVTFVIIRHGYSAFNKARKFTGQLDIPLDAVGHTQARDTAKYILANYKIDKIVSSDLCRAIDTAKPVADALGLPIERSADLRELNCGAWQGLSFEEVAQKYPESFSLYRKNVGYGHPDGGESYAQLMERASREMARIAEENNGKTVLVATHGGFVRCLRCVWERVPLDEVKNVPMVPNASVTVATYEHGIPQFLLIGYSDHLTNGATEFKVQ